MRTAFVNSLCELAAEDDRVWLITGDLGYSVLERFIGLFPRRFVNVGVAEQNMIGVAAGLALCGKIVFVYSIANFPLMRCLEQIRNDICYHNLNVKIVAVGAGFAYGPAGYTHHAVEDFAVVRSLPNMTIVAPADPKETSLATRQIVGWPGPVFLRLGKKMEPDIHLDEPDFQIGRAIILREGSDVTLVSIGTMLKTALQVADLVECNGFSVKVMNIHTLRPIDQEAILNAARESRWVFTIEEHTRCGGLGSAVAELIALQTPVKARWAPLGAENPNGRSVGSQEWLKCHYKIDVLSLAKSIMQAIEQA